MLAALPPALRDDAHRAGSRLHVELVDWYRTATPPEHLQAIAQAVWTQRSVALGYESWNNTGEQTLKPLGLVLKAGTWYIAALAAGKAEPRIYRLSGILAMESLGEPFRRPKKFHLPAFWQTSTQRFEAGIYRDRARLRVTRRGMQQLLRLGPQAQILSPPALREKMRETLREMSALYARRTRLSPRPRPGASHPAA